MELTTYVVFLIGVVTGAVCVGIAVYTQRKIEELA